MIKVESNTISEIDLVGEQERVRRLEKQGFSHMAILYFMSKNNNASGTYRNNDFVITINR